MLESENSTAGDSTFDFPYIMREVVRRTKDDVTLGKWKDFISDILIYGNFDQITVRCSDLLHRLYKKFVCYFFLANILVILTISLHDSGNSCI